MNAKNVIGLVMLAVLLLGFLATGIRLVGRDIGWRDVIATVVIIILAVAWTAIGLSLLRA